MRLLCCHDLPLSSGVHLVCRQELHLVLHLEHWHQQNHHRLLLDEVHRSHRDDLRLGDLDHLDECPLGEVHQLRRRQGEALRCRMKMGYCQHAVDAVLK
jgi:hypothetical protein